MTDLISTRSISLALFVGGISGVAARLLLAVPWEVAGPLGIAAGVIGLVMPRALSDGRFVMGGGRRTRILGALLNLVIMAAAMVGTAALPRDNLRLGLALLIFLSGSAAFLIGQAAVVYDQDDEKERAHEPHAANSLRR